MSVLERFQRNRGLPANATFRLTQQGSDKVQEYSGDPKSRVLVALETGGTSDIEEIAAKSGLSKGKVERIIVVLIRGGYVQYVSSNVGD